MHHFTITGVIDDFVKEWRRWPVSLPVFGLVFLGIHEIYEWLVWHDFLNDVRPSASALAREYIADHMFNEPVGFTPLSTVAAVLAHWFGMMIDGLWRLIFEAPLAAAIALRLFRPDLGMRAVLQWALQRTPVMVAVLALFQLLQMLAFPLLIAPGIWLTVVMFVAAPAAALERGAVMGGFRRSRAPTKELRWKVFALLLAGGATWFLSSAALSFVVSESGISDRTIEQSGSVLMHVLEHIPLNAIQILITVMWWVFVSVLFPRLRRAKDGPPADDVARTFA